MALHVLVVEDSIDSLQLVKSLLEGICEITAVSTAPEALEFLNRKKTDLILMDVMLQDGDGFSLTASIRKQPEIESLPIIFMTSRASIDDKRLGFDLGAEDYIVKPFDPYEFRLRVEARLKKIEMQSQKNEYRRAGFRLDLALQRAYVTKENINLNLTPLEFKILYVLLRHEPDILNRDQLSSLVWGKGVEVGRSLDAHITSLRKKLGSLGRCIQSSYGQGYRFIAD